MSGGADRTKLGELALGVLCVRRASVSPHVPN